MITYLKLFLFIGGLGFFFFSCVPASHLYELRKQNEIYKSERDSLWGKNKEMEVQINEMERQMDILTNELESLLMDSINRSLELRRTRSELERLTRRYENMQDAHEVLMEGSSRETTLLLEQLQNAQEELQEKEDKLAVYEENIDDHEKRLLDFQEKLETANSRIRRFENAIARQDSALAYLKDSAENVLRDIENEEINIYEKDRKVYISGNNNLFFSKDTIKLSMQGVEIITGLASLLDENPDMEIFVKVHCHEVPEPLSLYAGCPWELSIKRATLIVQSLMEENIFDPEKITAAGTGGDLTSDISDNGQDEGYTEIVLITGILSIPEPDVSE